MCCTVYSTESFQHLLVQSSNGKEWKRWSQTPHIVTRLQHEMFWNTKNSISEEEKAFHFFTENIIKHWNSGQESLQGLCPGRCSKSNWTQSSVQVALIHPSLSRWISLRTLQRFLTTSDALCGRLWNLTLHCWHCNTHLGCGQLSFKKVILKNEVTLTRKIDNETQKQRGKSTLLG